MTAPACQCGCGRATSSSERRYVKGHHNRLTKPWVAEDRGYDTPCHVWQGATQRGYGRRRHNGRTDAAHRVAWATANGPIPAGLYVLHHCDVPACVNPEHLFLGTQQDNMDDMRAKGRRVQARGEGMALAKLTDDGVRQMRLAHASGQSIRSLAKAYGVDWATAQAAIEGRTWKHVQTDATRAVDVAIVDLRKGQS